VPSKKQGFGDLVHCDADLSHIESGFAQCERQNGNQGKVKNG